MSLTRYDPAASGGCTVVEVRPGGHVAEWVGIAGTSTNCAGGSTPWGTWLTCEENSDRAGVNGMTKDHGYVFEVDPCDKRANRNPKPLKFFGRYDHEAVVIDPKRGHAYLTEDAAAPNGLLYQLRRQCSTVRGGGEAYLSAVRGAPQHLVVSWEACRWSRRVGGQVGRCCWRMYCLTTVRGAPSQEASR